MGLVVPKKSGGRWVEARSPGRLYGRREVVAGISAAAVSLAAAVAGSRAEARQQRGSATPAQQTPRQAGSPAPAATPANAQGRWTAFPPADEKPNVPAASASPTAQQITGARTPQPGQKQEEPFKDIDLWGGLWNFTKQNWGFALTGVGAICARFAFRKYFGPEKQSATGRMATPKEQREHYKYEWGKGYFLLGREVNDDFSRKRNPELRGLHPERRLSHGLVQAGPGAGKTTGLMIPQLVEDACSNVFNVYLVDRKSPELYYKTAKIWLDQGHRVLYFNPWDLNMTMGFEPLWGADEREIQAIVEAHVIVSPDPDSTLTFYRTQERKILKAVFTCAQDWGSCKGPGENVRCKYRNAEEAAGDRDVPRHRRCKCRRHMCTLPAVAELISRGAAATKAAIENYPEVNQYMTDFWEQSASQLASLFTGLSGRLAHYLEPGPRAAFSRADFSIDEIIGSADERSALGTILYVGSPEEVGDGAVVVASLMTQLVAKRLYARATRMRKLGKSWKHVRPLQLYLDEFGSYGVPNIDQFLATARSAGGCVLALLQDEVQLERFYDDKAPKRMRTTFRTKIYLNGCSEDVAQTLSDSIGKKLVYQQTQTKSRSGFFWETKVTAGESARTTEQVVKPIDSIITMPLDRALVTGFTKPMEVELCLYYKDERLLNATNESENWCQSRDRTNEYCDLRGEARPEGEPRRLMFKEFDWRLVPGVLETIQRSSVKSEASLPLTSDQKRRIFAKLRGLGIKETEYEQELTTMAAEHCKKPAADLTKADGSKLIRELEKLEEKHGAGRGRRPAEPKRAGARGPARETVGADA